MKSENQLIFFDSISTLKLKMHRMGLIILFAMLMIISLSSECVCQIATGCPYNPSACISSCMINGESGYCSGVSCICNGIGSIG
ncbi:hypothetical protein JTE90_001927 [Oedothorax gibbosus]|uniref:Uncharacterized protein n=1 Tax=Oedothorax gibbosus TaxID=931172 RepID=A0AAV6VTT3_9ARAC|nr:hypothetical protein JTE90_001927 [Oedothorax gibbosus]